MGASGRDGTAPDGLFMSDDTWGSQRCSLFLGKGVQLKPLHAASAVSHRGELALGGPAESCWDRKTFPHSRAPQRETLAADCDGAPLL